MALDANILGAVMTEIDSDYDNVLPENLEQARLERNVRIAAAIINHFKDAGSVLVPATGLTAPTGGGPVTGTATGELQ